MSTSTPEQGAPTEPSPDTSPGTSPDTKRKKLSLTAKITIAMAAGVVTGILINRFGGTWVDTNIVNGLFLLMGSGFVRALQMLVVPLVIFSLITGVAGIGDIRILGRVGGKAFALYLATTAIAISTAIGLALIIRPGTRFEMIGVDTSGTQGAVTDQTFWETLANIVPRNPIEAFASGDMLQIIFYVILLGIAVLLLGERSAGFVRAAEYLNELMMMIVWLVMTFAPFGVFALITRAFAEQGIGLFVPVASYVLTLVGSLLFHLFVTLMAIFWIFTRLNPAIFLRKIRPAQLFGFSTASSNATIPITLRAVHNRMGVDNSVASFTVPFGATINMDGTAIMQGVATVFLANVYGIDLGIGGYLTVIGMAVLASIGTAGVPGVGLIMLTMVLTQVGLPVEGIAIILGVDRIMDMIRTAVNITGDAVVSIVVAKSENQMDLDVYRDPDAGAPPEELHIDPEAERMLERIAEPDEHR